MDAEGIHKLVSEQFGSAISPLEKTKGFHFFEVDPMKVDEVAEMLKSHDELRMDSLSNLTGVDHPENDKITVVYDLESFSLRHQIAMKVDTDRAAPKTKTVEGVWRAAGWLEREVYDLLGVDFIGHHDLRRILLPDDWVGFPLRKDYVEAPEYHGISTVRESIMNLPGRQ